MQDNTTMSMEEFKKEMETFIEASADDLIIQLRARWEENNNMPEYV